MKEAEENNLVYIFIILDSKDPKKSILNIKSTKILNEDGKMDIKISDYLDDFPFKYYLIVKEMASLPRFLVEILRQYFESTK